jgi:hypothetical protein
MHNFIAAIVNGSYVLQLHEVAIIRPKHVAAIYHSYSKVVHWRVIFSSIMYSGSRTRIPHLKTKY